MKENRRKMRFDVCLTARWQGSSANTSIRISDLSEGGCYVDTIAPVVVGETVFLEILKPNGQWLRVCGIVAHHTPRLGFGVGFIDLSDAQISEISSLYTRMNNDESSLPTETAHHESAIALDHMELTSRCIM